MSIAHGQILQKHGFPCTLCAVLDSHGIVVNVQPPSFFLRRIEIPLLLLLFFSLHTRRYFEEAYLGTDH